MPFPTVILADFVSATTTNILQSTRLQSAPSDGIITFELQADVADATNNHAVTIQLPSGATPINGVFVPAGPGSFTGLLDDRQAFIISYPVGQGGHVTFSTALTGTSVLSYRITFTPLY